MPRAARAIVGDYCYHVINCGNGRAEVFHAEGDGQAFVNLLGQWIPDPSRDHGGAISALNFRTWPVPPGAEWC